MVSSLWTVYAGTWTLRARNAEENRRSSEIRRSGISRAFPSPHPFTAVAPAGVERSSTPGSSPCSCGLVGDVYRRHSAVSQLGAGLNAGAGSSAPRAVSCLPVLAAVGSTYNAAAPASTSRAEEMKLSVLRLAAGLDRGLAAGPEEAQQIVDAVEQLELEALIRSFQESTFVAEEVVMAGSGSNDPSALPRFGLQSLNGVWRLVYSSGFLSGSLGGLRPGPPTGRLPISLGQVLQRIDVAGQRLDNIVELRVGVLPWPVPAVEVTASLEHSFEALGTATLRISFERTTIKAGGFGSDTQFPTLSTPQLPEFLRPPSPTRSGQFETTYLDEDFRVSRGDLGELRVFVRVQ